MPEILGVNFLRPSDRYFCMKQNADVWEFGTSVVKSKIPEFRTPVKLLNVSWIKILDGFRIICYLTQRVLLVIQIWFRKVVCY